MLLNLRKPSGITSHDAVNYIRKLTGETRVGHGGTLDPFAEGVLVIGVGRESTKKLRQVLKDTDKEYIATLKLGQTSSTGDPEGEIKSMASNEEIKSLTDEKIKKALQDFTGEIEQTPPVYSAIKIKGTPAYKLARRGEKPALPKRKVRIEALELIEYTPPLAKIRTVVSAGTYIRSLAEDIGKTLGVGAYLQALIRTRVGKFKIEDSKTLEELEEEYAK
ncbi:MAG: tRNA pseudouridine(55) synthase TruB [Candidatus Colwellbacteria bacterium]|nr:tRNA pseudouridine(55) synthase TruB [Candidatus Colwellbacteria bacterium]